MYENVKQGRMELNIVFEPKLALRNPKGGEGSVKKGHGMTIWNWEGEMRSDF